MLICGSEVYFIQQFCQFDDEGHLVVMIRSASRELEMLARCSSDILTTSAFLGVIGPCSIFAKPQLGRLNETHYLRNKGIVWTWSVWIVHDESQLLCTPPCLWLCANQSNWRFDTDETKDANLRALLTEEIIPFILHPNFGPKGAIRIKPKIRP